jgi:hypothetical protein
MPAQQHHKRSSQVRGEQRHCDCRDHAPHDQGVPLPSPDRVKQFQGMVAHVFELLAVERQLAGVKQMDPKLDERDKEQQVQRRYDVSANQGCQLAQAEEPCQQHYEQRGEPNGRIDAYDHAQRKAPGQPPGRNPPVHGAQQGAQHIAAKPLADGSRHQHTRFDAIRRQMAGRNGNLSGFDATGTLGAALSTDEPLPPRAAQPLE